MCKAAETIQRKVQQRERDLRGTVTLYREMSYGGGEELRGIVTLNREMSYGGEDGVPVLSLVSFCGLAHMC